MIRNIILTIYCIILSVMVLIWSNINPFPQEEIVDYRFDVCLTWTNPQEVSAPSGTTHIIKSQHLTCQHTRAGGVSHISF